MSGYGVFDLSPLEVASAKTASFTAEAGYIYPVTLTSVTADLVLTFPSSPSTDDRFGVYVSAAHSSGGTSTNFADRPYFCIEPANTTSINGSSYSHTSGEGSSEYGLWLTGETMIYQYTGSTWLIVYDGRIKHMASVQRTTAQSISNTTVTLALYTSDIFDNAALHSTSTNTGRIYAKRAGIYQGNLLMRWGTSGSGIRFGEIRDNSATIRAKYRVTTAGDGDEGSPTGLISMSATDYIYANAYQSSGGSLDLTSTGNILNLVEQ